MLFFSKFCPKNVETDIQISNLFKSYSQLKVSSCSTGKAARSEMRRLAPTVQQVMGSIPLNDKIFAKLIFALLKVDTSCFLMIKYFCNYSVGRKQSSSLRTRTVRKYDLFSHTYCEQFAKFMLMMRTAMRTRTFFIVRLFSLFSVCALSHFTLFKSFKQQPVMGN